ncbi:glutamate racemase [Orbus hercynius]|uniref:Glutamate racemase n=1 Tax=Orbus hercynius TaxID=593135 RepID=A0A495RB19_9GAMM|nr:glutamate racemase [Orbus hercynius]RKS84599.1 glutamate racemase [Orbus hercynius]
MALRIPNILVFDSGIGGISVYDEIRQKIPHANYIYLFDNEAFPYGDKSSYFLIERVKAVIDKAASMFDIDIVVIACNTASTICLPVLRASFSFPIVGVVPAIKPATQITRNKCIGLLATKATIEREYTHNLIRDFAQGYQIELLGLSELALIAEQKLQGIKVNQAELRKLMQPWLSLSIIPDTVVLGCTHYPFIRQELSAIFPDATFIDSGYAIAARVYHLLEDNFELTSTLSQSLQTHYLVCSTLYNEQVQKIVDTLQKYNFYKYQLVKISGV